MGFGIIISQTKIVKHKILVHTNSVYIIAVEKKNKAFTDKTSLD